MGFLSNLYHTVIMNDILIMLRSYERVFKGHYFEILVFIISLFKQYNFQNKPEINEAGIETNQTITTSLTYHL